MKRLKVVNLPSLDDIKLLNQYVESESNDCYIELEKSFDYDKWVYLTELTMISILVYNRKRVGDTKNIILEYFKCKETMTENTNQQLYALCQTKRRKLQVGTAG